MAPVSNPNNRSLLSSSPSPIAPQVKAISQQQQQPQTQTQPVIGINSTAGQNYTAINGTTGQNYTFAATSPVVSSDKLLYLGYHGNGGSKDKDSSDAKPLSPHIRITATDNDSIEKKTSSITKLDITHSSSDAKPFTPPHIKITATDSGSSKKKTSTTKLDRTDSINDDSGSKRKVDAKLSTDHSSSTSTHSSSKDKDSSDAKPSIHRSSSATDNGYTGKKTIKLDRNHSTNSDSGSKHKDSSATKRSSHSDDGSKSSPDLASTIRNKVDSIIKNSLRGVRD
jgi:hypothetical protein